MRLICLAADGVYLLPVSPPVTVGSYPTRFTLTLRKSPGGIVSVALSLRLPSVAASNCLALCRPDFPLTHTRKRLADNLTPVVYHLGLTGLCIEALVYLRIGQFV